MGQTTGTYLGERDVASTAMSYLRARDIVLANLAAMLPRWKTAVIFFSCLITACGLARSASTTIVRFQTSMGQIDVRLYNQLTPNSVANFMNYVTANSYNGTFIHRVPQFKDQNNNNLGSQHFVVQGGGFRLNNSIFAATGITTNPPIGDEFALSNTRGTLSFAKNALGATSQWFFNVGNNSFLDASNFTVFGRVLGNGMTVVDSIDNLPAVNAAVAENAPGEDFDEIPIRIPLSQNDITSNEAVMVNVVALNFPAGDYDFNGTVNGADYTIWKNSFGSTTNAAADGNGNGRVDVADYVIWRNTLGQTSVPGSGSIEVGAIFVPEPTAAALVFISLGWFVVAVRRRRPS